MNCREFDFLVIEWVRGADLDAQTRGEAESHAAACGRCRGRLAGERALTASLEQLATSTAGSETRANVEDLLRMAFREQIAATQPHPAPWHLKNRWPMAARPQLGRVAWTGAAAAMVIAGVLFWMSRDGGAPPAETSPAIAKTAPLQEQSSDQHSGDEHPNVVQRSDGRPGAEQTADDQTSAVALPTEAPRGELPVTPVVRGDEPEQLATVQSQEEATPGVSAAGNSLVTVREVTTEFLPFPYAEGLSAGEPVQLIHVRLPGEALTFFGLPPAADPSAAVPADVLLGHDGTVRAVRFVRFTGSTTGGAGGGSHY
jgi:hypothetical protein